MKFTFEALSAAQTMLILYALLVTTDVGEQNIPVRASCRTPKDICLLSARAGIQPVPAPYFLPRAT